MSHGAQETSVAVTRVTAALMRLGDALAAGDLSTMLAVEPDLALLAARLSAPRAATMPPARADLEAARAALRRCERLGGGLEAFVRDSLAARQGVAYSRAGRTPQGSDPQSLRARG